ncbi:MULTISPECIES: ComF family protein [Mesorhizobium]|uniref:ComF family protein n=1 Tax=Mesorhizobium denitrificans TaxID=2294114 RepID=A0A371XFC5_9HYPH|nr:MULTISPECIES: ComF family protein [Mesorhizobium]RFC67945.1 ComF family protein [Mesorhizobium denitrificans]
MTALKAFFSSFADRTAQILFPATCIGCARLVSAPGTLCAGCWPGIRFLEKPWCEVMGTPFSHDMGKGFLSADAIANPPPFQRSRAAVSYSGLARVMVQSLKYRDQTDFAPRMAQWMLRAGSELVRDADMIVPVPLHRSRFFWRRFNQSAELARALAGLSKKPFAPHVVVRTKNTRQQVGLKLAERQENVRTAFSVPQQHRIEIEGRRVLLIDDVYTTGATVYSVTKALLKGGATAVDVLTFARVLPGDFRPDEPETI